MPPVYAESELQWALPADGYFDPAYFDAAYFDLGREWGSIATDVRAQQPITCAYGIQGNTPADRVASTGTLKFALNNSEFNSAQTLGYYSLLHAARRPGFDLNIGVRWRVRAAAAGSSLYAAAVLADNPSHYWQLNETPGSPAVIDRATGSPNAIVSGGVTLDGSAAKFDGATGKIATSVPIPVPLQATIEVWVRPQNTDHPKSYFSTRATGATGDTVSAGQTQVGGPILAAGDPRVISGIRADIATVLNHLASTVPLPANAWHHVVFVLNGSTTSTYIDGVFDRSATLTRTSASVGGTATIGYDAYIGEWFGGSLRDVAIYESMLTAAQVAAHYAAQGSTAGVWYYKFVGTLDEAIADPGIYGTRLTYCTAVDLWDDYAVTDTPDLPLQINRRYDQLLATLLDTAPTQPRQRTIEIGTDTYAYAFDGGTGQRVKIRERVNQLAASEFGYVYTRGDTTGGGQLVGENRQHRTANPPVKFNLEGTMTRDGLAVPGSRRDIFARVRLLVHPTNDVAAATTIVLWSLQQSDTLIGVGETNSYIFGAYFDPTTHDQIGGTETAEPVPYSDYTMNSLRDGTGTELTMMFGFAASRTGLGVRFTLTNFGGVPAYVTKLQVRGKPIYRYDAFVEAAVPSGYGDQILELDMPFQNSTNAAANVAQYLATRYATPFANASSVTFNASRDDAHMTAALSLEPGDRVAISESLTGLHAQYTINAVTLELAAGGVLMCTWGLEAATAGSYWKIGTGGVSELGVTTSLGI